MTVSKTTILCAALLFCAPLTAQATTPQLINFQGQLADSLGAALSGTVDMVFTIYDQATGGSAAWTETQTGIHVDNGLFNVTLGAVIPISDTVFDDATRYLEVQVDGNTLTPRTRLTAVAYAHRVNTVDGAAGGTISGDVSIQSNLIVTDKLGIGTVSPSASLDIVGTPSNPHAYIHLGANSSTAAQVIKLHDTSSDNGWAIGSGLDSSGDLWVNRDVPLGTAAFTALRLTSTGNLGVGVVNPAAKLDVGDGVMRVSHSTSHAGLHTNAASGFASYVDFQEAGVKRSGIYWSGALDRLIVNDQVATVGISVNGGNVGIGTVNPNYTLDVRGTVGNNATLYHSDSRWKKNINGITGALDKVQRLRGVTFEWKRTEFSDMHFPAGQHVGLIAQEVQEVMPELVHTAPNGYKSVEYANLAAVLIEAIKEQQRLILQQRIAIDGLESLVKSLAAARPETATEGGGSQ